MNAKQIKKAVNKNVQLAKKQGAVIKKQAIKKGTQLKEITKNEYDKLKKEMKISPAQEKKLKEMATKEYAKIKKQMQDTTKRAEDYIKKNPAKAAAISAGIGAALGSVIGMMAGKKKR